MYVGPPEEGFRVLEHQPQAVHYAYAAYEPVPVFEGIIKKHVSIFKGKDSQSLAKSLRGVRVLMGCEGLGSENSNGYCSPSPLPAAISSAKLRNLFQIRVIFHILAQPSALPIERSGMKLRARIVYLSLKQQVLFEHELFEQTVAELGQAEGAHQPVDGARTYDGD